MSAKIWERMLDVDTDVTEESWPKRVVEDELCPQLSADAAVFESRPILRQNLESVASETLDIKSPPRI